MNNNIKHKKLEKLIRKSDFTFDYFSSKIRVLYNKKNFTAHLRIKQDSIIWISLTGPFNIEGARIIITKDHFEMIDKLNKVYYNKPLNYIQNYFPLEVDYNMIEQLIIGNFIEKTLKKQIIETKEQKYIVKGDIENIISFYLIKPNFRIESANFQNNEMKYTVLVEYKKYEKIDNQLFSFRRNFYISNSIAENTLDLKFYKINNNKTDFPFDVPNDYIEK